MGKLKYDINKEQLTGVRYFIDPNAPVDAERVKQLRNQVMEDDFHQMTRQIEYINNKRKDWKNMELIPCNANVIVLPYDTHPYTPMIETGSSGLIIGGVNDPSLMKNPDSGEMEPAKKGIWCCKVISTGPKCENVKIGDDIYCRFDIAVPLAFGGLGYYSIPEPNIISAVRAKE